MTVVDVAGIPVSTVWRGTVGRVATNVALTVVAADMVTVHVVVPLHPPPLQPVKAEPAAGEAVRVTTLLETYDAEHVSPHSMPFGVLVTSPAPVPVRETVSGKACTKVTVKVTVVVLPVASCAVTVSTFVPGWRTIPPAVQLVVPVAVPVPPALFVHVTCVTPTLSDAVPPRVSVVFVVL